MNIAEIEHTPLAKRFRWCRSEDTAISTLAAWTVGLGLFTLAGFYIGTVVGHDNHPNQLPNNAISILPSSAPAGSSWRVPGEPMHLDLNPDQLQAALPYAAGGLVLGLIFALCVSYIYVPAKLRELAHEQGGHH